MTCGGEGSEKNRLIIFTQSRGGLHTYTCTHAHGSTCDSGGMQKLNPAAAMTSEAGREMGGI